MAWLICRKLHSLCVDCKILAAEFFTHNARTLGKNITVALTHCNIMKNFGDIIGLAEFKTAVPKTFFFKFHCKSNNACCGNCVHSQLVKLIVPFDYLFNIVVKYVCT